MIKSERGMYMHFQAVRYPDGSVYYHAAGHWYRPIGGEHLFVPAKP